MAGDWIKIELTTPDKPEVVQMAAALRIDQDAVVGKLIRIWAWADQNSVDGANMAVTGAFVDRLTSRRGFAMALRNVGWLTGTDGSLTFCNFDRHNGSTAKARVVDNRKKKNQRERDACTPRCPDVSGTNDGTNTGTREEREKREEGEKSFMPIAPAPAAALGEGVDIPFPAEKAKKPRERNVLLDALARATGSDPLQVPASAWGGIAKALAEIRAVCPGLTPDEIARRAGNYRTHMRDALLTPSALCKNWALCDQPSENQQPVKGRALFA